MDQILQFMTLCLAALAARSLASEASVQREKLRGASAPTLKGNDASPCNTSVAVETPVESCEAVQRRRRQADMCSCRRRSGFTDGGWRCQGDRMVSGAEPVWADEFDDVFGDGSLNLSQWTHDVGMFYNNEVQYYTDRSVNSYVAGGVLRILGRCESFSNQSYTSARLVSKNAGDFNSGHRIEVRARLPTNRGTWPAIWMLPTNETYGSWPYSGEIDIMESVGCTPRTVYGTVHTGAFNHLKNTQVDKSYRCDVDEWHTYAINWHHEKIDWYVDGNFYHAFAPDRDHPDRWPFNQDFHIILNLAIGGDWGGFCLDGPPSCSDPDQFAVEQIMEVDYVRVYKLDE